MPYLYITAAIIVLFVLLHKFTELDMKAKVSVSVVMLVLVASFYFFEKSNTNSAKQRQALLYAFEHGKSLVCGDRVVDKTLYNYASRSLIGKKGSKAFGSANIAINSCKIK